MIQLTPQENAAMMALWEAGRGSVHDILLHHEAPVPHKNTLTSTLKNLVNKGYAGFRQVGNAYDYYPLVSKEKYARKFYKHFLKNLFNNSVDELVSFIARDTKLSASEIEKIRQILSKNK